MSLKTTRSPGIGHNRGPTWLPGSCIPPDAIAVIRRPARSVMTSGKRRTQWALNFERRTPPFVEPLMGWTGGDDTMVQVGLSFPTRADAIAFAERQGLSHRVEGTSEERTDRMQSRSPADHRSTSREGSSHAYRR